MVAGVVAEGVVVVVDEAEAEDVEAVEGSEHGVKMIATKDEVIHSSYQGLSRRVC